MNVKNCQKLDIFSKKLSIFVNFVEKKAIFFNFLEKNVKFGAIFDIQMAIFQRVRYLLINETMSTEKTSWIHVMEIQYDRCNSSIPFVFVKIDVIFMWTRKIFG